MPASHFSVLYIEFLNDFQLGAILIGLLIGSLLCFTNLYFGASAFLPLLTSS
jgi:hypothetical protein